MNRKNVALAAGLALAAGAAWWQYPAGAAAPAASAPTGQPAAPAQASWPPKRPDVPLAATAANRPDSPLLPVDQSAPAVVSMTDARERGDDRTPPIVTSNGDWREPASPAELTDPARYQQYEERQQRRLYSAYVQAADKALPKLDADIARARAEGAIGADQIAMVEEKRRRIAAMQSELAGKLKSQ